MSLQVEYHQTFYQARSNPIEEDRSARENQIRDVARFLDDQLRADQDFSVVSEFPSLFLDRPGGVSLSTSVQSTETPATRKIVSHVGYLARQCISPHAAIKIGIIGSVVTHPDFRGRGYASELMQRAIDQLTNQGCALAILWSENDEFYEPMDFVRAGQELAFRLDITKSQLASTDMKVREAREADAPALLQLYLQHSMRLDRTIEELKLLLQIPKLRAFCGYRNSELVAYAVIGKGADFEATVHEWGGELEEVRKLILTIQKREFPDKALTVIAPNSKENLDCFSPVAEARILGVLGNIRLLNPKALTECYSKFLKSQGNALDKDSLPESSTELTQRILGCEKNSPHPNLPMFLWGLDSI